MYATDNYTFKRIQRYLMSDVQQVYNSCYRQHSLPNNAHF